jgi:nitroreductase
MDSLALIKARRSVRNFKPNLPSANFIRRVLDAGHWAPSGLNNQPWRFVVIKEKAQKNGLAAFTNCGDIILSAPMVIAVFMDTEASYNREKDLMAIGACIQNMLLEAHGQGLGTCWLGEILNLKNKVALYLNVKKTWELMALIAIGYSREKKLSSSRKHLKSLLIK